MWRILQDLMWAMVRSTTWRIRLMLLLASSAASLSSPLGGLLVGRDHSLADIALVGDPRGGVDSVEQSGRRLFRGEQQSIQGPGEVSVRTLTARETVGCDMPGNSPIAACTMLWRRYIRVARNDPDRPAIGRG